MAQAIERYLCVAPDSTISLLRIDRVRKEITEVQNALRPTVELRTNLAFNDQRHGGADNRVQSVTPGLGVTQTLTDSGVTMQRVSQRRANLAGAFHSRNQARRDLVTDSYQSYLAWALAHEIRLNALKLAQLANTTEMIVNARLLAGKVTRVDLLAAQSNLIEADRQVLAATTELKLRAQLLFGKLQMKEAAETATPEPLERFPVLDRPARQNAMELSMDSPALSQLEAAYQAAQHALEAEKSARGWNVRLTGFSGPRRQSGNTIPGLREAWYTELGISATLPLYDAGTRTARIAQLQTDLDIAHQQWAKGRLDHQLEWARRRTNLEQANAALDAAQASLEVAMLTEKARRAQYEAGLVSLTELINAQNEVANRSRQVINSKAELRSAELSMWLLQGAFDQPSENDSPSGR